MPHPFNFSAGWWLILGAFVSGAVVGLGFHRTDFLGGYGSFRRRLLRLGHISLAALGMINVLYGLSPGPGGGGGPPASAPLAGLLLVVGGVAMPVVCFLSAWQRSLRHLFFVPVLLLMTAVGLIIRAGGAP